MHTIDQYLDRASFIPFKKVFIARETVSYEYSCLQHPSSYLNSRFVVKTGTEMEVYAVLGFGQFETTVLLAKFA
jgi:hypothetical protein